MLRTLLLFLLCLLLPVPQGALAASSGKTPVQAETSLPLNRTTFHFFSPEDIAANYKASKIIRVGYFDQHGVFEGEGEHLSGYAVALLTAISRYTGGNTSGSRSASTSWPSAWTTAPSTFPAASASRPSVPGSTAFPNCVPDTRTPVCMSPA